MPDPASDVYGLGALLYEALTGRPPVLAATWAQAAEVHRHAAPLLPPDPHGLPPAVADLCLACLDPNPRRRPPAAQVAAALDPRQVLARATAAPAHPGFPRAVLRTVRRAGGARRRPSVAALIVLAAGVVGVALLGTALFAGGDGDPAGPAAAATPAASTPATGPAAAGPDATGPAAPAPSASGAPPATDPSASALVPAVPLPSSPAAGARAVVDLFDRELTEAAAAGRVRADVAVDLRNGLADLRTRIDAGPPDALRQRVVELRRKLDERLAERAIDAQTAARLTTVLDPLLA
jgi:serine/threonine-protein kinase